MLLFPKEKLERDDIDLVEGERGTRVVLRIFWGVGGVQWLGWRVCT